MTEAPRILEARIACQERKGRPPMTAVRIRCISVANPVADPDPPAGKYLVSYDPEALGGRGSARWTDDPAKALVFADPGDALDCWQQVPRNCPERPDGRPNRPLTAYTIELDPVRADAGASL